MVVQVHGFDWNVYAERVMPAFAQWLLQSEEGPLFELFSQTRYAHEEKFTPPALQQTRLWPRARVYVETLPHGPYSRREFRKLCSAEYFTALSDRYLYKHPPQLYQNPEALRTLWSALIETYCLPWSGEDENDQDEAPTNAQGAGLTLEQVGIATPHEAHAGASQDQVERDEMASLLAAAGLDELAQEVHRQEVEAQSLAQQQASLFTPTTEIATAPDVEARAEIEEEEVEEYSRPMPGGVVIGAHPNVLHLRGWLAGLSVHAMALFEFLACGRRSMPFGHDPSEPYGVFIGYLTVDEVWRLGTRMRGAQDPVQAEAEEDYLSFRYQHPGVPETYRLADEVLPTHAAEFHRAVDAAAAQGLGLICSIE